MDSKEYISTGMLELYAAGMLNENDSMEVEEIIKKNSEVKSEYENILKTVYLAASINLKVPSKSVKDSIISKIKNTSSTKDTRVKEIQMKRRNPTFRYLVAACVAFLILSLGTNFFLWTRLKDAKNEIAVLSDQKKVIVQENEAVNRKLNQASRDMEIMKDRSYKMIDLKGLEKSPGSNVLALWNPVTKKVYVEVLSLPVPPANKQYQLWAISNGKPVDGGVMDVDPADNSLHAMKNMEDAQAFAITLEPKGGSISPTMDQMYVMGKL